jgi:hypothetical protein
MLSKLIHQLRRRRRTVLWGVAVLAVVSVALTARSIAAGAHGHGEISDAAAICVAVGACVAASLAGAFVIGRPRGRPLWTMPDLCTPAQPWVPASTGCVPRAGPPALLQVFRL